MYWLTGELQMHSNKGQAEVQESLHELHIVGVAARTPQAQRRQPAGT